MRNFSLKRLFGNNSAESASTSKNKRKRNRTCRIEELEGREMLSVTPWSLVDDVFDYGNTSDTALYTGELAPPALKQNAPILAPLSARAS